MTAIGKHYQPDHWPSPRFPQGAALQPVAGVRPTDAEAFCNWLTERERKQGQMEVRFRLPTPPEALENSMTPITADELFHPLRTESVGTWCSTDPPQVVAVVPSVQEQMVNRLCSVVNEYWNGAFARALALDLASTPTVARVLARARRRARALAIDLARALASARALALDLASTPTFRVLALARAIARAVALALDFDRARARARTLALDLASTPTVARVLARALALEVDRAREPDFDRVQRRDFFAVSAAMFHVAAAWRLGAPVSARSFLPILFRGRRTIYDPYWKDCRNRCLEAFLALCVVEERIKGNLPAWEGIRVVREGIPADEKPEEMVS